MKRILSFLPLAFVVALAVATPITYTSIDAPNSRGTMVLNGDFKTYADTKTLTSNFELLRGSITKSAAITTGVLSATTASIASMSVSTGAFAVITGTSAAVGSISANTASAASVTVTTATLTRVTASSATFSGIDCPNGLTSGLRTWQVVYATITASGAQDHTITGINGKRSRFVRITAYLKSGNYGTASCFYTLRFGSSTVDTANNYGWEYQSDVAGAHTGSRSAGTDGVFFGIANSSSYLYVFAAGIISIPSVASGRAYNGTFHDINGGDLLTIYMSGQTSGVWRCPGSGGAADINIITVHASVAGGIAAGSEIIVEELR